MAKNVKEYKAKIITTNRKVPKERYKVSVWGAHEMESGIMARSMDSDYAFTTSPAVKVKRNGLSRHIIVETRSGSVYDLEFRSIMQATEVYLLLKP